MKYTAGELAKKLGVSARTVRFYHYSAKRSLGDIDRRGIFQCSESDKICH